MIAAIRDPRRPAKNGHRWAATMVDSVAQFTAGALSAERRDGFPGVREPSLLLSNNHDDRAQGLSRSSRNEAPSMFAEMQSLCSGYRYPKCRISHIAK
jgi:hypothetical protein